MLATRCTEDSTLSSGIIARISGAKTCRDAIGRPEDNIVRLDREK